MAPRNGVAKPERGQDEKLFVVHSVLLNLIDPVRGEPTRNLFEQSPDDIVLRSYQLKEKFLDSFALICSTSKSGGETASAVCMEQNQSSGTVLRVARNCGLSQQDLTKLERVLQILIAVANGDELSAQAEGRVLEEIVDIDKSRILALIQKLEKGGMRRVLQHAISRLCGGDCTEELLEEPVFAHWIKTSPFLATALSSSGTSELFYLVKWAAQARWTFQVQLQQLLASDLTPPPPWVETLHKLARYWGATKSMVKFAVKQPEVFAEICIKGVKAPAQQSFSVPQETAPLKRVLRGLVKDDWETVKGELAKRWETDNADAKLRRACRLKLTLHAEMQLLDFYERNTGLIPQLYLMGTSKKACFHCYEYLRRHPLRIRVSACHQKIYPTWMPPTFVGNPDSARHKFFRNFSKYTEQLVIRELRTGLATPRRAKNYDSTAGPTLTVTATDPTHGYGTWHQQLVIKSDDILSQGY